MQRSKLRRVLGDITNSTPARSSGTMFKSKSRGLSNSNNHNAQPIFYPNCKRAQPQSPQEGYGNFNKLQSPSLIPNRFTENRSQSHYQLLQQLHVSPKNEKNMDDVEIGNIGPFEDRVSPDVTVDMQNITEGLDVSDSSLLQYDPVPAQLETFEDPALDDLLNDDDSKYNHHRIPLADITDAIKSGAIRRYVGNPQGVGSGNLTAEVKTENKDIEHAYGAMYYTSPLPKYDPGFDFNVSKHVQNSKRIGGIPSYTPSPVKYEVFHDSNLDDKLDDFSLGELGNELDALLDL